MACTGLACTTVAAVVLVSQRGYGLAEGLVVERGVLTASDPVWDAAARRAAVIGGLAERDTVGLVAAGQAAAELGISRRQVYVLVGRWRAGEGVVSDLLPGFLAAAGGRAGCRPRSRQLSGRCCRSGYLTRQRRTVAAVCREIARECRVRGFRVPSRGAVLRRIGQLDPVRAVAARQGEDAARVLRSAGGVPPEVAGLLDQVQVDHTVVDLIVVDERHRLPIGRPYLTVAIDVASRCVVGTGGHAGGAVGDLGRVVPGARRDQTSRPWLERLGVEAVWPMSGKPAELYAGQCRGVQERGAAAGL